jgi:hypothetical protein
MVARYGAAGGPAEQTEKISKRFKSAIVHQLPPTPDPNRRVHGLARRRGFARFRFQSAVGQNPGVKERLAYYLSAAETRTRPISIYPLPS